VTDPAILPQEPRAELATPEGRAHYTRSLDCVHCGLCLPVCPTYKLSGRETASPRGRIYMMRAQADGRLDPTETFEEELKFCLVCRACETVCPSGVQFEALMEHARADLVSARPLRGFRGWLRTFLLRTVVPSRGWLRISAQALAIYSKTPLKRWAAPLLRRIAPDLLEREALMPQIPPRRLRTDLPPFTHAQGNRHGRVALHEGCVASQLLPEVNRASARVLSKNRWDVVTWSTPSCCGALHAHAGDLEFARELARKNIEAFEKSGADWFVWNSAGCGSHVKAYPRLLEHDEAWHARAKALAAKTRDISELLTEHGFSPRKLPVEAKIAYDEPCHLVHGQRVSAQPKQLLNSVPGAELVPLSGATDCCGAAGLYSLERTADSLAVLDSKMEKIRESGATMVATGNPGCILQIRTGAKRHGLSIKVVHPVQLLDEGEGSEL